MSFYKIPSRKEDNGKHLDQIGAVIPAGKGMKGTLLSVGTSDHGIHSIDSCYSSPVLIMGSPLDVQLLVVDRASLTEKKPKMCEIGQVGELFVRAGGLAEGQSASQLSVD